MARATSSVSAAWNWIRTTGTDIWKETGSVRLKEARSTSYSSGDGAIGADADGYSQWGEGSYASPHVQDNDTWFRGFSKTTYENSWKVSNAQPDAAAPPITDGFTLSFDGNRYQKALNHVTNQKEIWGFVGKAVFDESITYSFSSDNREINSDPKNRDWGGGTYAAPVVQADHTFNRSKTTVDGKGAFDQWGKPMGNAGGAQAFAGGVPEMKVESESGETYQKREFANQADMDATISGIEAALGGWKDVSRWTAGELQLQRILADDYGLTQEPPEVVAKRAAAVASLRAWAAGHNAASTTYDEFHDFMLGWLDTLPSLGDWKNADQLRAFSTTFTTRSSARRRAAAWTACARPSTAPSPAPRGTLAGRDERGHSGQQLVPLHGRRGDVADRQVGRCGAGRGGGQGPL